MSSECESTAEPNLKLVRSPPIPKEVNQYVLMNFGAAYYKSTDFNARQNLLKSIETVLNRSGYQITAAGIERRLKNMKSHYRRKKSDMLRGNSSRVDWQYFDILQKIFDSPDDACNTETEVDSDKTPTQTGEIVTAANTIAQKRKRGRRVNPAAVDPAPTEPPTNAAPADYDQPQDLSIKKPKVEEPTSPPTVIPVEPASIVASQPLSYLNAFINNQVQANQESYHKILEGLRAINEHRTALSEQIRHLEDRRRELDNLGLELTNFLIVFQQIDSRENLGIYN